MNPKVDAYVNRSTTWPAELVALRAILLGCGLTEEIKWGKPCYGHDGANIAIMQEMKGFLALMFFKGALLDDPAGVLRDVGPNSRSARRIEFTSVEEITGAADTITDFVSDAIAAQAAGLVVAPASPLVFVAELQDRIATDPVFRAAFEALTPGRQREYHLSISDAKQAATRTARVEKYAERILAGKGLRDRRA